jgi:hypothetical protein
MHHIISDGFSIYIIMREFTLLYNGEELPRLKLHYKDYSQWLVLDSHRSDLKKQQEYWLGQFQGEFPVLNLPTDFDRTGIQTFAGDSVSLEIDPQETEALNRLAQEEDATLYMVLEALLAILLSKMTGQQDIVIGTALAGRNHPDLEGIPGMFVNTLALRNFPSGEKTFREFLQEVRNMTLGAFENQDYPFEELVDQLGGVGNTMHSPLFDVMFTVNNIEMLSLNIPGVILTPYPFKHKTAKFDLTIVAYTQDTLVIDIEYRSKLFTKDRIQRFTGYLKDIVSSVIENRETRLEDITVSVDLIIARQLDLEETFDF